MEKYIIGQTVFAVFPPRHITDYENDGNIVECQIDKINFNRVETAYSTENKIAYTIGVGFSTTEVDELNIYLTEDEAKSSAIYECNKEILKAEERLERLKKCKSIVESK